MLVWFAYIVGSIAAVVLMAAASYIYLGSRIDRSTDERLGERAPVQSCAEKISSEQQNKGNASSDAKTYLSGSNGPTFNVSASDLLSEIS